MEVISNTIATVWDNGTRKNTGHSGKMVNCQMKCKFAEVIARYFKDETHP